MMTILIMAVPLSLIPLGNSLHAVTTSAVITFDSVVWAPPGTALSFLCTDVGFSDTGDFENFWFD